MFTLKATSLPLPLPYWIYENHFHRLTSWNNRPFLSPANLQLYAQAVSRKGSILKNCFGFVDGTVRQISRPGDNQHLVYNGHKRVPALKFQAVVIPSGLVANLYAPIEGRRHDAGMLEESGLLNIFYYYYYLLLFYFISHTQTITIHYIYNSLQVTVIVYKKEIKRKRRKVHKNTIVYILINILQRRAVTPTGDVLCIYGDPPYPLRPHLMGPYRDNPLTPQMREFNKAMSEVRVSVEWLFSDIAESFKFIDYKKKSQTWDECSR